MRRIDTKLTGWIAGLPRRLELFFSLITNLGHPAVVIGMGAGFVALGIVRPHLSLFIMGIAIWITLGTGSLLKLLIHRARPLTDYAAKIWLDKLSFPSGHTTGATIAFGLLAYWSWLSLPRAWSIVAAISAGILIFLVGVSRIYLGAHFPSDVVAGWLLGGVGLVATILLLQSLS